MDCALKLNGKDLLNYKIGNVRWRSPETQVGRGVGKHSDVFSFALLVSCECVVKLDTLLTNPVQCIYTITELQFFEPTSKELEDKPELEVLIKFLSMFGPLPDALIQHVETEEAETLLTFLWNGIRETGHMEPFASWPEDTIPNLNAELKRLISRMTKLDPAKRASISDIIRDPYWD